MAPPPPSSSAPQRKTGAGTNKSGSSSTAGPNAVSTTSSQVTKANTSSTNRNSSVTASAIGVRPYSRPPSSTHRAKNSQPSGATELAEWVGVGVTLYLIYTFARAAYEIRILSIKEFGPVIHEFDPYFNYRATEYLYWNGWKRFFTWFDYMVWYPLGRPVGTTIYPGMQFTAVWIKRYLSGETMSLNDICCYIPAWYGVIASSVVGLIAYECSIPENTYSNLLQYILDLIQGQTSPVLLPPSQSDARRSAVGTAVACGLASMAIMAIVPAHLMRSVGGGYDNESVAISAMVLTFYCWIRSLRRTDPYATVFAVLSALSYFYMVASWGGYVFVLNLIGLHAAVLVITGRFSTQVWASYTLFYLIGTALAIQVPVVGQTPVRSLEQLGPGVVWLGYQLLQFCEVMKRRFLLNRRQGWILRLQVFGLALVGLVIAVILLAPKGYFGPISSRVRGLFVKHTKTGNPLVDSVAEHQPASNRAYFTYLHQVCALAPIGYLMIFFALSESSSFLLVWGLAAYYFSVKMVRLILLTASIGSVLGGIAVARLLVWCLYQWWEYTGMNNHLPGNNRDIVDTSSEDQTKAEPTIGGKIKDAKKKKTYKKPTSSASSTRSVDDTDGLQAFQEVLNAALTSKEGVTTKRAISLLMIVVAYFVGTDFVNYCWRLSYELSNPSIILRARRSDGGLVKVDDYREAYWWLRDNTPPETRVMAWWDYGYQISAIANRTTLADGNTWNHEHIALLGKALTTDLDEGWEIARHLADVVLIWGGGGGDDLAKSPHLARIANSVYRDHCPGDPTCSRFGFIDGRGTPSAMMARSLLYRLHGHKIKPDVEVPEDRFVEIFRSKYGKVRIYKIMGVSGESKAWVEDPANRKCDAPGSWFCPGQYPPGLSTILAWKKDFRQLEDFNRGSADDEYTQQYFKDLHNPGDAKRKALEEENVVRQRSLSDEERARQAQMIDKLYNTYEDTEDTTLMWKLISSNAVDELRAWLQEEPHKAFIRSRDGRGPMWWAFEQRNDEITQLLMKAGVPHTDRDVKGLSPTDLLEGRK